jgi:hypothetical protein
MRHKYIDTVWETWTYDVWGNKKDGYEVNDRYQLYRDYPLRLRVEVHNKGTDMEFESAYPSDKQIREALNLKRIRIHLDGDDRNIYVNHDASGYPCGELYCVSHESLSPIREWRKE